MSSTATMQRTAPTAVAPAADAVPLRARPHAGASWRRVSTCAASMKAARAAPARRTRTPLAGHHVALLFDKPSLRTRSTFVIAVRELGGDVIEPPPDVALGGRETIEDVARNLERWVFGVVVRTFAQERLERFAAAAPRPARRQRADRRGASRARRWPTA